jgi:tRNA A37 threonylcarbamoyltransferase TsaD
VTGKLCADFQDVAFEHLEDRLRRALDFVDYQGIPVTSLVVVGGVAANGELRR